MTDRSIPARFEVLDEIAHGEGEILLRARDLLLQREVVLRRPAPELTRTWPDASMRAAEMRSARALAQVRHPGVVRLLDVLETADGALVVLEPVAGESLSEIQAREVRLDPARVEQLGRDLADALTAVHAQGVVHRGVSAANVIVRADGTPCLLGFVFAKFVDRASPQSSILYHNRFDPAAHVALPPHPAPEQIAGQAADARADQFALGWVLYEALTGAAPYPRDREPETWTDPTDPVKHVPGTSRALSQALLRCLKRNPARRFASVAEFGAALARANSPAVAAVDARPARAPKSKLVPLLTGFAVAAAAIAAIVALRAGGHSSEAAPDPRGIVQAEMPVARASGATYGPSFSSAKALLIGISDYSATGFSRLPNAELDVKELAKRLEALRASDPWEVRTLLGQEATRLAIKEALVDLARATQDPESRVFIYYAGHGQKDDLSEMNGFIVPVDARPEREDRSRSSYLMYEDCFDYFFNQTKAKHVLLALDCCYAGRIFRTRGAGEQASNKLLENKAHIVLSSSLEDEQAQDGEAGKHSPFARAFLELLLPARGVVTTSDLYAAITNALSAYPDQRPLMGHRSSDSDGQFVFFTQNP